MIRLFSRFALFAATVSWVACGPEVTRPNLGNLRDLAAADGGAVADEGAASDDAGGELLPDLPLPGDGGNANGPCDNPLNLQGCGCMTPGATRACYRGAMGTRNLGRCQDGAQTCVQMGEFTAWGPCSGDTLPGAETCDDGMDRNCNGKKGCDDPECAGKMGCCAPGQMRGCYSGPLGSEKVGPCRGGMQTCTPQGAWPIGCPGEVLPGVEAGRCQDGIDNDCNGLIDCKDPACVNDPACRARECMPGQTKPCYTGPQGTSGVGACKPGLQSCDQSGQWAPGCVGEVKPVSEFLKCKDKIDNDCDGLIDCADLIDCLLEPSCMPNACQPGQMRACYSGPQGTQNVGPCRGGMQSCAQDGKSWGPCMGEVLPGLEGGHCNDNLDNDCNGPIDCKDPACNAAPNCCMPGGGNIDGTIYVHSPDTLYKLDPNNWTLATIGNFAHGDQTTDVAVTPDNRLFAISFGALYSVDKASGKAKPIGQVPGMGNNALTFLPDGSLLAADSSGQVKRINPNSGAVMDVGNFGNGLSSSGDVVAVGDGTMFGTSATSKGGGDASADNVLVRIDTKSGAATVVGAIGFGSVWGLAYANNRLIGFTSSGVILTIDPQTGKGTQVANKGIQFWGAGMSPLVPPSRCP